MCKLVGEPGTSRTSVRHLTLWVPVVRPIGRGYSCAGASVDSPVEVISEISLLLTIDLGRVQLQPCSAKSFVCAFHADSIPSALTHSANIPHFSQSRTQSIAASLLSFARNE